MVVVLRKPRYKQWVSSGLSATHLVAGLVWLAALAIGAGVTAATVYLTVAAPLPGPYIGIRQAVLFDNGAELTNAVKVGTSSYRVDSADYTQLTAAVCATVWLHVVGLVRDCAFIDFQLTATLNPALNYEMDVPIKPQDRYPWSCNLADVQDPVTPCKGSLISAGPATIVSSIAAIQGETPAITIRFINAPGQFPVTLYTVFLLSVFALVLGFAAGNAAYQALIGIAYFTARRERSLRCYLVPVREYFSECGVGSEVIPRDGGRPAPIGSIRLD